MRKKPTTKPSSKEATDPLSGLPDAPPAFLEPMQAKLVDCLPEGDQWRYELKLDGFRALAIKTAAGVQLISRNRKSLSEQFPQLLEAVCLLPMGEGVLDGEIVAVDEAGKPSFQALQFLGRTKTVRASILYFAFDLLNVAWQRSSNRSVPLMRSQRAQAPLGATASRLPSERRLSGLNLSSCARSASPNRPAMVTCAIRSLKVGDLVRR
jgi:ATP-dependent DNA ligase